MNRDISPIYRAYARSNRLHPILLVTLNFDSGVIRLWNGYEALSYGGESYTGAGKLLTVASSEETQELKASGVTIGLTGISTDIVSIALSEAPQGRPVNIKMGFLTGDTAEILEYKVTVSGGNYYVEQAQKPLVSVIEGHTYRFDQSDSTNSGHNIRISTTSNGTHGGGSQYTSGWTEVGTAGTSGAYNQWVVPSGASGTFYYYCQNHSGYGGTINVSTDFVLADPFTLFEGQMDTMDISDNGETADVIVNCESKLISLQNARPRRYTKSDQNLTFPDDEGLDYVPSLQDKEIVWGRS